MTRTLRITASLAFAATAALVGQLAAHPALKPAGLMSEFHAQPIAGADIITAAMTGVQNWGGLAGTGAYSLSGVRCNVGDTVLIEDQFTNQHHISGQQMYRVRAINGTTRIEQVGMSWCFHGFCALQQTFCGSCTPAGGGCVSALGIGCSDVYTPARCGSQNNNGPRYDINVSTGFFSIVPPTPPISTPGGSVLGKRIQVANSDLDPALNPGAQYFSECLTIQHQDALAGNAANNAAHRRLTVGAFAGTPPNQFHQLTETGPSFGQLPAIHAWRSFDPSVTIVNVDVPTDGRFVVGYDVTDLGNGRWHYEYAIYNISSHRSGQSLSVPIPSGVKVSNIEFRDIDYHTQQILPAWAQVDNVDWTIDSSGAVTWSTSVYTGPAPDGNEHTANALRWGTLYNFRFDADAPPQPATATLALFRPGSPDSVSIDLLGPSQPPPCPEDLNDDGQVSGIDLAMLLGAWGSCPLDGPCLCAADLNCDGWINGVDLATLLAAWGDC